MNYILVGVGGGTGSGKSTLCRRLLAELGDQMCLIHLDSYFFPDAPTNNQPRAIDIDQLYADLQKLQSGETVSRTSRNHEYIYVPRPIMVIEGHLALTFPELVEAFDLRVFVDMDVEERLMRRIERNVAIGRSVDSITSWYRKDAKDNHWQYIEPTKKDSDIIIWGEITDRRVKSLAVMLRALVADRLREI